FKPIDRIALFPKLEQFGWNIAGVVVRRMSRHSECLAFDQCRATPGTCPLDGAGCSIPDREDVVAVHDFAGHSIGFSTVGYVFNRHLPLQRCRVSVLIVVADKDNRHFEDRSHIDAFVPVAAAGGAVTKETERNSILTAHFEREADSCRHWYVVPKHAHERDQTF